MISFTGKILLENLTRGENEELETGSVTKSGTLPLAFALRFHFSCQKKQKHERIDN